MTSVMSRSLTLTDGLNGSPIFDEEWFITVEFYSELAVFAQELPDPSHVGVDFNDGPLFNEALEDHTSAKLFIPDSEFMVMTTTLVTCLIEFPSRTVNTTAQDNTILMEVVNLPDMVFDPCYIGMNGLGYYRVPFLASVQLQIGASTDVTPSKVHI
jgi:hypothetical protein